MKPVHCRCRPGEPPSPSDWVGEPPAWRAEAACIDHDPEFFFPLGTTGPAADQAEAAKAVCANCPVIAACLNYALTTGQDVGVWGGTTEDERRQIRRKRRQARRTTVPRCPR